MAYAPWLLDPFYEQGRRSLLDQMYSQLAQINAAKPELGTSYKLGLSRLGTQQGQDLSGLNQGLAGRGLYDSGVRTYQTDLLNQGYARQRQDASFDYAKNLSQLAQQAAQARSMFGQGMDELRLQVANRLAQDPYASLPRYGHGFKFQWPHPGGLPPRPSNRRR